MYSSMTFESILNRMLEKIPEGMDKREGSIIYDALAPCAWELMEMYIGLDTILYESFADTASREYLIRRAKERGLEPLEATNAVVKGKFNKEIEIGTRFDCEEMYWTVIERLDDTSGFYYSLKCQTAGIAGNINSGELLPEDAIYKLEYAYITELIIPARDEEDTEIFRQRYLKSFNSEAFGGNVDDYVQLTNNIDGVGSTKVTPVWNGGGTVKLTLLNSEYNVCSSELVNLVQETIDPNGTGDGVGLAPIGHIVTVESARGVTINVSTKITFGGGYTFNDLKSKITEVIEEYILSIRKKWDTDKNSIVRVAQIEALILNVDGVVDVENTKINGGTKNIVLGEYQVPILGGVVNE